MLCITMRKGDYFLIGKDIVVQLDTLSGSRVHLTINAPKDVPIVRGEVLERNGGKRPDCVYQD
ncbi:MAG: carbon storage regulator [Lawsonibacter sp.]|nr:carbon storage regulator [Lawsonibacter sp.]